MNATDIHTDRRDRKHYHAAFGRPPKRWSDDNADWCEMWMFTIGGCTTGERQTTMETNQWPQRPTWIMSSEEEEEQVLS